MRILFIHPFLFRYMRGIERFTLSLSSALARRGVQVDLLTWRWSKTGQVAELDSRVGVYSIPTSRYYAAKFAIPFYVWHLLTHAYDFIWVYFAGYGEAEAFALASWVRPLTYGITFHYPFSQVPHRYREFERYDLARRARGIVAISAFVAEGVRTQFDRLPLVIRSAADTSHFQPNRLERGKQRASLGLSTDAEVLCTVAALEERKGIQHVIHALPAVLTCHPHIKYVVLGEGPYRAALESLIQERGLQGIVELQGSVANILPYYNLSDLFVLLSRGEGLPAALLEAMAMELPLVVSHQPPFDELVDRTYGIFVAEDDPHQVAAAINTLLGDPDRRRAMGEAARARVLAEFTYDHMAEQYIEFCRREASLNEVHA